MTDTDIHQPDPGSLRVFGYPVTPFGAGGAWLVTGRRGTEAGR